MLLIKLQVTTLIRNRNVLPTHYSYTYSPFPVYSSYNTHTLLTGWHQGQPSLLGIVTVLANRAGEVLKKTETLLGDFGATHK